MDDLLPQLSDRALELIAHRFKILGDATRLRLLQLLMSGEMSVNELVNASGNNQANVSKHLSTLANDGLILRRRDGASTRYSIADPSIFNMCDLVCRSLQARGAEVMQELQGERFA